MKQISNVRIGADTAGRLLTLQALSHFAIWGAFQVEGWLMLLGCGLAVACFALLVLLFVTDMKQTVPPSIRP